LAELTQSVERILAESKKSLTLAEIANGLDAPISDVDHCLWTQPDRFIWQPGHRWALAEGKTPFFEETELKEVIEEARTGETDGSRELRATTLANGLQFRVVAQPSDSQAFFTIRSSGATLSLVVNSGHELFSDFPMPFADDDRPWGARALLELLLESWALHEATASSGDKRRLEETRMLWGRHAVELLEKGE
jgi:hypothetical protein